MRIGSGKNSYEWISNWAKIPDSEAARGGWAHHSVVVTEAGEVIASHQSEPQGLVFDRDGNLKRSWQTDLAELHGITLVKEGNTEYLWIADNGSKRQQAFGYDYLPGADVASGQVVKMTLEGQIVAKLERPSLAVYQNTRFSPTAVAVNEVCNGGNGDVWVTDGYGTYSVHRFNKNGEYISSITGEEGQAGAFNCPHAIFVDQRKSEPELYVADRGNGRIQVYDLEGRFKRVFGSEFLTTPSAFVTHGDGMVVAELRARLTVLDIEDQLVTYLGANEAVCELDGWPNWKNNKGEIVRTNLLETGKFNSPHGIGVDSDGNLYLSEWLIGGRFTKLVKC